MIPNRFTQLLSTSFLWVLFLHIFKNFIVEQKLKLFISSHLAGYLVLLNQSRIV